MKKNKLDEVVTKGYLEDKLFDLENSLEKRFDKRIQKRIEEAFEKYTNSIMNKLDSIIGEVEKMREDREIGAYQTSELRTNVEDHEKRIRKLEHLQKAA